jgi:membrane dipeptidase
MKNITIELLRRGYKKADIEKIWGGNVMRVFREVENAAKGQVVAHNTLLIVPCF